MRTRILRKKAMLARKRLERALASDRYNDAFCTLLSNRMHRAEDAVERANLPTTRFVVALVADQTVAYRCGQGYCTVVHREATFFKSRAEAEAHCKNEDYWVEVVPNVKEFCARPDTW